jgi:hypothetical protein
MTFAAAAHLSVHTPLDERNISIHSDAVLLLQLTLLTHTLSIGLIAVSDMHYS